jgi:replicative DNA helicase
MGAWEDALATWGGPEGVAGAVGGFAYDWLCAPEPMGTGVNAIDSATGGLPRGEVCVLAGDAGMGKTALATQLCYHAALRGMRPAYVSLEMSRLKCQMRMVACHARLHPELFAGIHDESAREVRWASARPHPEVRQLASDIRRLNAGDAEATDTKLMGLARSYELQDVNLPRDATMVAWRDMDAQARAAGGMMVVDSTYSLEDVEAAIRAAASGGSQLAVIDYVQLVDTGDREEYDRMAHASRELRALAKELGIAMLAISALRKVSASERSAGPSLDWLKGNNALAYDAGQVLFLLRPDGGDAQQDVRDADLYVAKNRNGASGMTVELAYDAPHNLVTSRWLPGGERYAIGAWA